MSTNLDGNKGRNFDEMETAIKEIEQKIKELRYEQVMAGNDSNNIAISNLEKEKKDLETDKDNKFITTVKTSVTDGKNMATNIKEEHERIRLYKCLYLTPKKKKKEGKLSHGVCTRKRKRRWKKKKKKKKKKGM